MRLLTVVGSTTTGVPPSTWNVKKCVAGSHFMVRVCVLPMTGAGPLGTVLFAKLDSEVCAPAVVSKRLIWKRATPATQSRKRDVTTSPTRLLGWLILGGVVPGVPSL